jgi:DNA-binding transcriptional LysR family regulator
MFTREGFSPEIIQETGEMYTVVALVAAGVGIAILPQSVVLAQSRNVLVKPLFSSAGLSEIAIAVRRAGSSSLIESFTQVAETFCQERE